MSTPQLKPVLDVAGETKPDSYIVKLKSGVTMDSHLQQGQFFSAALESTDVTRHHQWSSSVLNGYAVTIKSADVLDALRADPDIDYIEKDGIVKTCDTIQPDSPWGLQRISQRPPLPKNSDPDALSYQFKHNLTGSGADIYVIDTGIYTDHEDFHGRAEWGTTCGDYENKDGNGHGTHCAGSAGSHTYGVAKEAKMIAVKVLNDKGEGTISSVISGVNWAATQQAQTGRPSVASMSLGGSASRALDDAVNGASNMGLLVVVAAGNDNKDANDYSPSRAAEAFTIGASDIGDVKAPFSNYGTKVDLFAPGKSIISTFIGSPSATANLSGTSMATPHVAGICAAFRAANPALTPSQVKEAMRKYATQGALSNLPPDTVNLLAYNGDETA